MARTDVLSILYAKKKSIKQFDWNSLIAPPMLSILSAYDINLIESINRDPRLISEPKKKKQYIDNILKPRGLVRFAAGTNRVVYKYLENQSILFKVAVSQPGMNDCNRELYNQQFLKPFCAKCFEASPGGSIGLFERVETINTYEQYLGVAEDHFNLLDHIFGSGKFIMEDVGSKFWRNIGIRTGFGVVFVDYPMLFELDGNKLFCRNKDKFTGMPCGGEIDVDAGYNHLFCRKCGMQYMGTDLAKKIKNNEIIVVGKEENNMRMKITYNGQTIIRDSQDSAATYLDEVRNKKPEKIEVNKSNIMTVKNNWKQIKEESKEIENTTEESVTKENTIDSYKFKCKFTDSKDLHSIDIGKLKLTTAKLSNNSIKSESKETENAVEDKSVSEEVEEKVESEEEPKEEESKEEEIHESNLFGTPQEYNQEYPNPNKMNRREKRKNDKKHKNKHKNNKHSIPVSSPVPKKGLNNMQYNMEDYEEESNDINFNKFTHF